ncbi:MAG: glutamine synthetase III [Bacilli bacterium]|nr:glutamine synthetase III [Bacilli bacterium]
MAGMDELFGIDVFSKKVMKTMLSAEVFKKVEETMNEGKKLDREISDAVASAMKNWAVSKGATHYTHWFQPMTGITAEKHDGFIAFSSGGNVIMDFSGKELIKGEPDASSFPSGGLRSTFEARGYTVWDPTSYAFVKGKILYIPTAFCAFSGEAIDKKTPLLRSMDALSKQAVRVLDTLGIKTRRVLPMVGVEQEYFLIDKEVYKKRKDLIICGRTLFGAPSPKDQQLDDHYFGMIKPRIQSFMEELNETLWRLGIPAKTEHNEVAPSQHELAPIYESCNIAADHNQLTMEIMQKVADKHGLVCLLNEKPFAGVNGSGKHNNWSLATDSGLNLLSPGKTEQENLVFYLFLTAIIKAVDEFQDLLRISVATSTNDNRLGGSEAPPVIVSMFLGEELTEVLDAIASDTSLNERKKNVMKFGVTSIPEFVKDSTDRNRTSPFAFTGNKFEFRMLGSQNSISCTNIMLNSAVAYALSSFADRLEKASDISSCVHEIIKTEYNNHKRIIFNGNGYGDEWVKEAKNRGLLNLPSTPDCLPYLREEKNIKMFLETGVLSSAEIDARYNIQLENYSKSMLIEAATMLDMTKKEYLPAICKYQKELVENLKLKKDIGIDSKSKYEIAVITKLDELSSITYEVIEELEKDIVIVKNIEGYDKARYISDVIKVLMNKLRENIDKAEVLCKEEAWPLPSYSTLLFSV